MTKKKDGPFTKRKLQVSRRVDDRGMIGSDQSRFEEERDGVQRREVDGETFWQSRHESSRVGRSLRSDLEVRLHLGEALRRSRRHHRTEGWKTEDGRRKTEDELEQPRISRVRWGTFGARKSPKCSRSTIPSRRSPDRKILSKERIDLYNYRRACDPEKK